MATLINLAAVGKSFTGADGTPRRILDGVDFTLREGEIVALLGKSGIFQQIDQHPFNQAGVAVHQHHFLRQIYLAADA